MSSSVYEFTALSTNDREESHDQLCSNGITVISWSGGLLCSMFYKVPMFTLTVEVVPQGEGDNCVHFFFCSWLKRCDSYLQKLQRTRK